MRVVRVSDHVVVTVSLVAPEDEFRALLHELILATEQPSKETFHALERLIHDLHEVLGTGR